LNPRAALDGGKVVVVVGQHERRRGAVALFTANTTTFAFTA
jgi:hypothetical protein